MSFEVAVCFLAGFLFGIIIIRILRGVMGWW